jgi:hypothetical protein
MKAPANGPFPVELTVDPNPAEGTTVSDRADLVHRKSPRPPERASGVEETALDRFYRPRRIVNLIRTVGDTRPARLVAFITAV